MNKYIISLLGILLSVFFRLGFTCESQFDPSLEPGSVYSPLSNLKISLYLPVVDKVPFDIRQRIIKAPGDYYRYPSGAKTVEINNKSKKEIENYLYSLIDKDKYDSCILGNLIGLKYAFKGDSSSRSEYFLRYCEADTIYVVSGWLDKFLSFYRAIPGFYKYDWADLNSKISEIAAVKVEIPKDIFEQCSRDNPYFIEYVDRERMLRVRCYSISEQQKGQENPLVTNPYTLIEITRFIDKEMIP